MLSQYLTIVCNYDAILCKYFTPCLRDIKLVRCKDCYNLYAVAIYNTGEANELYSRNLIYSIMIKLFNYYKFLYFLNNYDLPTVKCNE